MKLNNEQIEEIRRLIKKGYNQKQISNMLNIGIDTVRIYAPIKSRILGKIYWVDTQPENSLSRPIEENKNEEDPEIINKNKGFKYFLYLIDNIDDKKIDISPYKDNIYIKILSYLYRSGNRKITSKRISKNISIDKMHVAIELRHLANSGYIYYNHENRRVKNYTITEKGKELYEKIVKKIKKLQAL